MDMTSIAAMVRPASAVLADLLGTASASIALAALGRALVEDDQATAAEVETALKSGSPDLALKVKDAEQRLLAGFAAANVPLAEIAAGREAKRLDTLTVLEEEAARDRSGARSLQAKTNSTTNKWLAYGVTFGFFVVLAIVIVNPSAINTNPLAQTLIGVLGTGWVSIIAFYFGSSVGSKEKTALLEESITKH